MRSLQAEFQRLAAKALDKDRVSGFSSLNEKERTVLCVAVFEAAVSSGGFREFLWNECGDRAAETVSVLNRIGAGQTASLLTQALEVFPDFKVPKHTLLRQQVMTKAGPNRVDALRRLDHEFNRSEEDLCALAVSYVLSLSE